MIEQTLKEGANSVVPTHPIGAFTATLNWGKKGRSNYYYLLYPIYGHLQGLKIYLIAFKKT